MATTTAKSILVVEDESSIRDLLRFVLVSNGFSVIEAEDAQSAYSAIDQNKPDLILLDWMLPKASGIDIAKQLRSNPATQSIPIIMLTARAEEESKVSALKGGADDYVVKPFSPRELIARIQAVMRRVYGAQAEENVVIQIENLKLDEAQHKVTADNKVIELTALEYRLLCFFMKHINRIYTRAQLLDYVWGNESYVDERTIDATIRRLRKALHASGCDKFIQTVRGVGYRFSQESE